MCLFVAIEFIDVKLIEILISITKLQTFTRQNVFCGMNEYIYILFVR